MSKVMARAGMDHDHAFSSASQSSSDKIGSDGLKKGPWTAEEDQKLVDYIKKHGRGRWRTLPKNAGLKRCGKSCRLRWTNYLRPDIKRGRFSSEEEGTIIQLHSILGNKWSAIAARLPGRTDNEIKNYWNTHIKKRLLRMGINPVTHTPRLDLLELSSLLSSSLHNYNQYPNQPNLNLLGLLEQSSSPNQNNDFIDMLKELVISQNIPQETLTSYPNDLLSGHQFQNQNRDTSISTSQNSLVDQYYSPYPSSLWDSNYGCLSHNKSSILGADDHSSYQQENTATDDYMVPSVSSINPNCGFRFDNHVEEAKNMCMGSTIASTMSNDSSFTFNVKHGAGGRCNNEEQGYPYGTNVSMYDIMKSAPTVQTILKPKYLQRPMRH